VEREERKQRSVESVPSSFSAERERAHPEQKTGGKDREKERLMKRRLDRQEENKRMRDV